MVYLKPSGSLSLPKMVLGSFNIVDRFVMTKMVNAALENGVNAFDTSPSYGSEEMLGNAIAKANISRDKVFISDKIDGWQMFEGRGEIEKYLDNSLRALKTDYLDILLVHWPFPKYILPTWKCMERMCKKGKVRAIGLCNVNARIYGNLMAEDVEIKPLVVQNEISPFYTDTENTRFFLNEGIAVEAYSPLCRMIPEIRTDDTLNALSKKYNKSIAQIILRWHIERGIIPVFTSSKPERIFENTDILDFSMENEDIDRITSCDRHYKIFPESFGCPGY